jgi:hypothetical protein
MQRLAAENALAQAQASAQSGPAVVGAAPSAPAAAPRRTLLQRIDRFAPWGAVAALLVVGAMLSYQWLGSPPGAGPSLVSRFSVVRAADALIRTGAVVTPLADGQGLGEGVTILAKEDEVVFDCSDASEGRQPAA